MKCKYCEKEFENKKSMSNHIRWHNIPKYKNFQISFSSKVKEFNTGKKNGMWKGDNIKYGSLHDYIKYYKEKPQKCSNCKKITKKLDLANISQNYLRDFSDYEWLCRKCHMIKDGRYEKLKKGINWRKRKMCCPKCNKPMAEDEIGNYYCDQCYILKD